MKESRALPSGSLVENRIFIWDIEWARNFFKDGFYGKPLGIPKPKDFNFNAPLILDLLEGYFLAERGKIVVKKDGKKVPLGSLEKVCMEEYKDFKEKHMVYKALRKSGYVVAPGIKFGCDFAVYEHGPGIDHAPYLVQVVKPNDKLTATGIVLSGRLATTVRKQFIVAVCDAKKKEVLFVSFDWWRA